MFSKKVLATILVVVLSLSLLSGCTNGVTNGNSTVVTGGPDDGKVVLSFGEDEVTVDEFRYYVYIAAMEKAYSIDPEISEKMNDFDWNSIKDDVIKKATDSAFRDSIMIEKVRENGITLSDEEKKTNSQSVESARIQNGEEVFLLSANAMAIDDVESYKNLANRMMLLEKAEKEITDNIEKYKEKDMDLSKWKSNEMVTAQHVLISNESEKFENPEETAKEVLKKAKDGEDFAKLIEEYNEDPGATAAGYTFGPGEMVKEFEDAAFALDCDEISDVVKTDYGFHVIHRITGLAELQNYWVQSVEYKLFDDVLGTISVEEIMLAAAKAQEKLQEMSTAQNAG